MAHPVGVTLTRRVRRARDTRSAGRRGRETRDGRRTRADRDADPGGLHRALCAQQCSPIQAADCATRWMLDLSSARIAAA